MQGIQFTEENAPDLVDIPLKGEMLRELVRYLRDSSDFEKMGISLTSPIMMQPGMSEIAAITTKVADEIAARMDSDSARSFGIDRHDLAGIVRRVTGQDADELDVTEAVGRVLVANEKEEPGINADAQAITQMVLTQIMPIFSLILAVQEGKENELLAITAQVREQGLRQISAMKFSEEATLPNFSDMVIMPVAISVVLSQQGIAMLKETKSPVLSLVERMNYGEEYPLTHEKKGVYETLDHAITTFGDIDPDSHAGRQRMQSIRANALSTIREGFGIVSNEID